MLIHRSSLLKTIKLLSTFDNTVSPFVGVQWEDGKILFHRSSSSGFIESLGFTKPTAVVSLTHFKDRLSIMPDGELDISLVNNGVVLKSNVGGYSTELYVYTLKKDVVWSQTHKILDPKNRFSSEMFKGIRMSPSFTLASPPVLKAGRLMLPTMHGVIFKAGSIEEPAFSPRETFIKALNGASTSSIDVSQNGYYVTEQDGHRIVIAGHKTGEGLYNQYDIKGERVSEYPAKRLIEALDAASTITKQEGRIAFDPSSGILVQDEYGNTNKFAIGTSSLNFSIVSKTGRVLIDALGQDSTEIIEVFHHKSTGMYQFVRGNWEVVIKPSDRT